MLECCGVQQYCVSAASVLLQYYNSAAAVAMLQCWCNAGAALADPDFFFCATRRDSGGIQLLLKCSSTIKTLRRIAARARRP